jgi:hypothetical protein
MPDELRPIVAALLADIRDSSDELRRGRITADQWQADVARALVEHHAAAWMAGQGADTLSPKARVQLGRVVGEQVDYLNRFADQIAAEGWREAFGARAAMYAGAVKESYWRGFGGGLPLPGYPTVGTRCLSNCGCTWELDVLDAEEDNVDAYWRRGKSDSCSTCIERERNWSPFRIRGGRAA